MRQLRIQVPDEDKGYLRDASLLSTTFGTLGLTRQYNRFRREVKKKYLQNIDSYAKRVPNISKRRLFAQKKGQLELPLKIQSSTPPALKQLELFDDVPEQLSFKGTLEHQKKKLASQRKRIKSLKGVVYKKAGKSLPLDAKFRGFRQLVDDSFWLRPKYSKTLPEKLHKMNVRAFRRIGGQRLLRAAPFAALAFLSIPTARYFQARKAKNRKFKKELIIQGKRSIMPVTAGAVGYGLSKATDQRKYRKAWQKDLARATRRNPRFKRQHGKYSAKYNVGRRWWHGDL